MSSLGQGWEVQLGAGLEPEPGPSGEVSRYGSASAYEVVLGKDAASDGVHLDLSCPRVM
jgi:hypothetical protein